MRKADMYKKINRNTIYNHSNRVSPSHILSSDFYDDLTWSPEEQVNNGGVQITELRSSGSENSINDDKDYSDAHPWCYTNQNTVDDYKINKTARENRRMADQNQNQRSCNKNQYEDDFVYAELFVSGTNDMQNDNVVYNQMNCFSILDKHLMNSDTSSDGFGDVEVVDCSEPAQGWHCDPRTYDSECVNYSPEADNDKRTVWIYSFKNKRLLSENDFELVNIPSQDSSIEDFNAPQLECPAVSRVPTPIPPPHVPRLYLPVSPTLPTLTEVTEPEKLSCSNQTEVTNKWSQIKVGRKENNWFLSEHVTPTSEKGDGTEKSASIINWMALSPREKRRRFRNASPIPLSDWNSTLPTLKEVSSITEKIEESKNFDDFVETEKSKNCDDFEDSKKFNYSKGHDDKSTNTEEVLQSGGHRSRRSVLQQSESSVADSATKSIRTLRSNVTTTRASASTTREDVITARDDFVESISESVETEDQVPADRGDHKCRIPSISLDKKSKNKYITSPIENLDNSDWIREEKLVKESDRIRTPKDARGDRASDALWIRNMALLKPAEWSEYLPIAESIPSLHLSINTDSIEERQSWLKRVIRFFRCCK